MLEIINRFPICENTCVHTYFVVTKSPRSPSFECKSSDQLNFHSSLPNYFVSFDIYSVNVRYIWSFLYNNPLSSETKVPFFPTHLVWQQKVGIIPNSRRCSHPFVYRALFVSKFIYRVPTVSGTRLSHQLLIYCKSYDIIALFITFCSIACFTSVSLQSFR